MDRNNQKINNLYISKEVKNKKYKLKRKNMALRITAGIAILSTLIAANIGYKKYADYQNTQTKNAIVIHYGQHSIEKDIFDYIMLSEDLHKLNLGNYEISNELIEECNIPKNLLSPEEINKLIKDFSDQKIYIPNESIDRDYDRVVLITQLIYQEKLVNQYIYEEGYDYAHQNITKAAKEYAGEVFGINPSSITFSYTKQHSGEPDVVSMKIIDKDANVINSYRVSGWSDSEIKKDIKEAVSYMDMTDKKYDKDNNDNNEYNRDRNVRVINALKLSSNLFSKVNNNNLYSEDLNEKLTGKSK